MAKKKQQNPIEKIAARFGVTAREARDIATAVSNVVSAAKRMKDVGVEGERYPRKELKRQIKNVGRQVAETGRAAATGKKGTTAGLDRYTYADKGFGLKSKNRPKQR